jgi:hypothetical protein
VSDQPSLREQYQDLKYRHEPLLRAAIRLIAAFDPCDPSEAATLVHDLGIAAGISSQHEAESILRPGSSRFIRVTGAIGSLPLRHRGGGSSE